MATTPKHVEQPSIRVLHASGRFDRPAAPLGEQFGLWARTHRIIEYTEHGSPAHEAALRKVASEHAMYYLHRDRPRGADCGQLADRGTFVPLWSGRRVLTHLTWTRSKEYGGKPAALVESADAVISHTATGKRILLSTVHFPSNVEGRGGFGHLATRVRVHRAAMKGWAASVRLMRKRYLVDEVILDADFNLNLSKPWVRAYIKAHFPRLRIVHSKRGSLGNRPIDGWLTTMIPDSIVTVQDTKTSDHRAVSVSLRFRNRPKRVAKSPKAV